MISLKKLLDDARLEVSGVAKVPDIPIRGVECDSRKVEKGFLFVAIQGVKADGGAFIGEALRRGASAVVVDRPHTLRSEIPLILVPESRQAVAKLASVFYGDPSRALRMIGVTGTNGKTTTSFLLEHFLRNENLKVGVIGTVSHRFPGKDVPASETTPGPLRVQEMLSQMRESRCGAAVMEVSSHALDQHRVDGIDFEAAIFTNLTQDHLDYHRSMEAYFDCKSRLFTGLSPKSAAILNQDDPWIEKLKKKITCRWVTYGVRSDADLKAVALESKITGTVFELIARDRKISVRSPLVGLHNVYNVLGALAAVDTLGFSLEKAAAALASFRGVPGRLEPVECGQSFRVFIDYAHTPDGLLNVLRALEPYKKNRLIVVFGCGGDRDKDKRPKMGKIASDFCDQVFITSDNPRSEDPRVIAEEIRSGFPAGFNRYSVVLDRRKAIRQALLSAKSQDIVLLAGKGHETTQVIGKEAFLFNERDEAERVLGGH
ncbi:MAG: UDP-N-acetylmuramoyl-L-alanyl-D-glutamate--2,6-diaminopimelate ligase [Candidatus Omnitrophica bacterium]|nr:UDP-N-acetylmuramoyl-L-alanyl-D-glutamate--2,6-diaminopimelate ligase [Candidatus Omnitrophota bacterium]